MLSYSSAPHERRSYSVDEVVDAVFADDDTADEYMQSESSGSSEVATPEPIGGNVVRRGPETRNWRSQRILSRAEIREGETIKLEERWKSEENRRVIPDFPAQSSINTDFTDDSKSLEFLDLFLDNDRYMYLTDQANLHATQYLEAHPDLPPHSHCCG